MSGSESHSALPAKLRLFLAVVPEPAARSGLADALVAARAHPVGAALRWSEPARLHLTLQFLDSVEGALVPAISEACAPRMRAHAPFELTLSGAGSFPTLRRASVLWLGATRGAGALTALAATLAEALEPLLGVRPEARSFTPHLTLARSSSPRDLTPLIAMLAGAQLSLRVDSVQLIHSRLQGSAPSLYQVLAALPLGA